MVGGKTEISQGTRSVKSICLSMLYAAEQETEGREGRATGFRAS